MIRKPRAEVNLVNMEEETVNAAEGEGEVAAGRVTYKLDGLAVEREDFIAIQLGDISNALDRLTGGLSTLAKIGDLIPGQSGVAAFSEMLESIGAPAPAADPAPAAEDNPNALSPEELADLGVDK